VENLKNKPFPYCHLYHVHVGNTHGKTWIFYTLHCDYPNPTDKRNISEIHRRLGWTSTPLKIFNIKVIKKDYNGQTQNQQHIKLHKEAAQKASRNSLKMPPIKIKALKALQEGL
jgi:hypothetical protein